MSGRPLRNGGRAGRGAAIINVFSIRERFGGTGGGRGFDRMVRVVKIAERTHAARVSESLEFLKMFEGALIGAGERGFVADDEGDGGAGLREMAEGPREAEVLGDAAVGFMDVTFAVFEVKLEQRGFEGGDAEETPAGERHLLDGVGFDGGLRGEFGAVGVEQMIELGGRFVGEDQGFRAEAVLEGVARGAGFSFGRDGSSGFFSIGSGGFGF